MLAYKAVPDDKIALGGGDLPPTNSSVNAEKTVRVAQNSTIPSTMKLRRLPQLVTVEEPKSMPLPL